MDLRDRLGYLFGTEEHVDLRRQLVLLRERLMDNSTEGGHFVCSGSLGEGVSYPSSDDDLMIYLTSHRVMESYREITQRGDLLMVPSEFSPGYCLLLDVRQSYPRDLIHIMNEMPFVSSSLLKQKGIREGESVHGPCLSQILVDYNNYEYDHAFCISCTFWPDIAHNWAIRSRPYGWPSYELIRNIVNNSCHVVPIGDTDSPLSRHEWRISFSVAERMLMHSLDHVQFLTYNLLRLCLKRVIDREVSGVLCSYFMKTALFHTSEKTSTHTLQVDYLETYFKACLSVLYDFVDHKYCPNHFMPEYNMMKRKINHSNRDPLLGIIRTLHNVGVVGSLHLCGESRCFHDSLSLSRIECQLDNNLWHSLLVHITIKNFQRWILDSSHEETEHTMNFLCKVLRILQGFSTVIKKIIFRMGITFTCYRIINLVMSSNRMNKSNYCFHRTIESLLKIADRADVTSGKLTRASYMYLVGNTESALLQLRQLLSRYPPYAIDQLPSFIKMTSYMDVMCGRGYTMDYKLRHAYTPVYSLDEEVLNAFPLPQRIVIISKSLPFLDPLTYAYCLENFCYIRLQNHTALKKSTRCLVSHIGDMTNISDIARARMCVGIIKYEQGDNQSACRWLGSAYMMKDAIPSPFNEGFSCSVMMYIACMLNWRF